jgi:hypothetical protein
MRLSAEIVAPHVHFFSGKSESFVQDGSEWHRLDLEGEARLHTGLDRETKEPHVGVYISSKNGRVKMGFDLWRLDVNLTPAVLARLKERWQAKAATLFSKTALRTIGRKVHISKSFVTIVTTPEHLDGWRRELEAVLSNADSYGQIDQVNLEHREQP